MSSIVSSILYNIPWTACLGSRNSTMVANTKLSKILDQTEDMCVENGEQEDKLIGEHEARVRAEAMAEDRQRRLQVAQTQLVEFVSSKQEGTEKMVSLLEQCRTGSKCTKEVLGIIQQQLGEELQEARAFTQLHQQEQEKLKRNMSEAELENGIMDTKKSKEEDSMDEEMTSEEDEPLIKSAKGETVSYVERAKYIPLRLSYKERQQLRLLEATLSVSEYTDMVDVLVWKRKDQRIVEQIKAICRILSGLLVAHDYKAGQKLLLDKNFKDNQEFFRDIFEIGRRHKIMNPEKMRSEYGKLVYMLMDSSQLNIQELLEFECVKPLATVYTTLSDANGLKILEDPLLKLATDEIMVGERQRHEIQQDIRKKEKARKTLASKYRSSKLSEEQILHCIYSINDNNSFLLFNRDPIDRMIWYLNQYFSASGGSDADDNLSISMGMNGARLSHSHEKQFHYVQQSLMLWREISNDMFKLWCLAERDLISGGSGYRLADTGQGLNRVQQARAISSAIHGILNRCKSKLGHWVGSSVVHLGDHNVPNALMFIDKYTQVPRILNPVVLVLDELPKLCKDEAIRQYVQQAFGNQERCRKLILLDFFRHAFDGSGADNFFDAGSCIDGRLTSAWNWCSKIEKKPYYHLFKMAGFVGFDGDFQK
eukprot:TRINITY_DN18456_c0_g3_i1.p1 TRINITY_DN18456_c0_g3~~TRINITY_DN18456_c0_g3_i1.p1  ORF type:complete len:652 (-),score=82.91 TRINITY_DN18456_c0_g3_i1:306-2261(-)